MYASFEDKGKIYTNIVSKTPIDVIIQTPNHQIHGKVHVRPNGRLKDELTSSEHFWRLQMLRSMISMVSLLIARSLSRFIATTSTGCFQ
jgi:hypothetical protein